MVYLWSIMQLACSRCAVSSEPGLLTGAPDESDRTAVMEVWAVNNPVAVARRKRLIDVVIQLRLPDVMQRLTPVEGPVQS